MSGEYVIDPSALIQAYIEDEFSSNMQTVIAMTFEEPPLILHTLDFGMTECLNIFWKRIVFHELPLPNAQHALENLHNTPLTIHRSLTNHSDALVIGVNHHLPMYDALYIALAKQLDLPLLTADKKQADIATKESVSVKALTDFAEYSE